MCSCTRGSASEPALCTVFVASRAVLRVNDLVSPQQSALQPFLDLPSVHLLHSPASEGSQQAVQLTVPSITLSSHAAQIGTLSLAYQQAAAQVDSMLQRAAQNLVPHPRPAGSQVQGAPSSAGRTPFRCSIDTVLLQMRCGRPGGLLTLAAHQLEYGSEQPGQAGATPTLWEHSATLQHVKLYHRPPAAPSSASVAPGPKDSAGMHVSPFSSAPGIPATVGPQYAGPPMGRASSAPVTALQQLGRCAQEPVLSGSPLCAAAS